MDEKGRALTLSFAVGGDAPIVQFHQMSYQEQTQAKSAMVACTGGVLLAEAIEQLRQKIR